MKQSTSAKKVASKGDRLNWTPLKEVKQIPLHKNSIKGRQLTSKDLCDQASTFITKRKVLVP